MRSLDQVKGVGPFMAKALTKIGFSSAEQLAGAAASEITLVPGIGTVRAASLIAAAKALLDAAEDIAAKRHPPLGRRTRNRMRPRSPPTARPRRSPRKKERQEGRQKSRQGKEEKEVRKARCREDQEEKIQKARKRKSSEALPRAVQRFPCAAAENRFCTSRARNKSVKLQG